MSARTAAFMFFGLCFALAAAGAEGGKAAAAEEERPAMEGGEDGNKAGRAAKQALTLKGTQAQKALIVDLDKTELSVDQEYLVPEGATLTLIGAGKITPAGKKSVHILVEGSLVIGDAKAKPKDLAALPKIECVGWSKIALSKPSASLRLANCWLIVRSLKLDEGRFYSDRAVLDGAEISVDKGAMIMKESGLRNAEFETELPPGELAKRVKLANSVICGKSKLGLGLLWCMSRCDLHGRPLSMIRPSWKPPSYVQSVYIADAQYLGFMEEAMKSDVGLKFVRIKSPFNAGLGLGLAADGVK